MASEPLDWQLQCKELKQRCDYLFHNGLWSDCSFLVGSEPDQACVPGHKLILAMASPVFEAMFYGGMAQGNNELIRISDIKPEAFKAMFEYIYTDNINISSIDMVWDLYYGGKKYWLPHLVEECTQFLLAALNPSNACRAYKFASLFEDNVLIEKCLQIIRTRTKEVLADNSFEDVELDTMVMVFSLEELNVDSELDLFEAVVRYTKAQDKRQAERPPSPKPTAYEKVVNVDGSADSSPESDAEPRRAEPQPGPSSADMRPESPEKLTIRSAIEKIRFLTLTPEQFLRGPDAAEPPLLAMSEAHALLKHIILPNNPTVPLPQGLSTSRVPRGVSTCRMPHKQTINQSDFLRGPDAAQPPLLATSEAHTLLNHIILPNNPTVPLPQGFSTSRVPRGVSTCPMPHKQAIKSDVQNTGRIDEARSSATFRFTLTNFRNRYNTIFSPPFYMRNMPWKIVAMLPSPNTANQNKFLGFFLHCCDKSSLWSCQVKSYLSLISHNKSVKVSDNHLFNSEDNTSGFLNFMAWNDVLNPEKGYIKDDAITLEVVVKTCHLPDVMYMDEVYIWEKLRKTITKMKDPNECLYRR